MKSILIAVLAACVSMLITSGIVAFATAAPIAPDAAVTATTALELDAYVSAMVDEQYRQVMSRSER